MDIVRGKEEDALFAAMLHREYIVSGFLSSLGTSFLTLLYKSMINSNYAFCLVAKEEGRIVGFISGSISLSKFYREFLKYNYLRAIIILSSRILNSRIIKNICEIFFYSGQEETNSVQSELLSIVVDGKYQGKGVSKRLFDAFVEELKIRNIRQFKVAVGSNLIAACKFYEKMGGILDSEIEVHKGTKSKVYIYRI